MRKKPFHSPTPWRAELSVGRGAWIAAADGNWGALSCGNTDEVAEANAAFIVRAVNAHEALIEALERANVWLAEQEPIGAEKVIARNLAALRLAKTP